MAQTLEPMSWVLIAQGKPRCARWVPISALPAAQRALGRVPYTTLNATLSPEPALLADLASDGSRGGDGLAEQVRPDAEPPVSEVRHRSRHVPTEPGSRR